MRAAWLLTLSCAALTGAAQASPQQPQKENAELLFSVQPTTLKAKWTPTVFFTPGNLIFTAHITNQAASKRTFSCEQESHISLASIELDGQRLRAEPMTVDPDPSFETMQRNNMRTVGPHGECIFKLSFGPFWIGPDLSEKYTAPRPGTYKMKFQFSSPQAGSPTTLRAVSNEVTVELR